MFIMSGGPALFVGAVPAGCVRGMPRKTHVLVLLVGR